VLENVPAMVLGLDEEGEVDEEARGGLSKGENEYS
jgi:hypothetical protein